jgi:hypothetical protein
MAAAMDIVPIVPTSDEFIGTLDRLRKRGKFMQKVFYQGTMDVKRDELLTEEKTMWRVLQSPLSSEKRFFEIFSDPARFEKVMNVLKELAYLQREIRGNKISFYRWHANYAAQVFAPQTDRTNSTIKHKLSEAQRDVWNKALETLDLGGRDGGDVREVYYYWLKVQVNDLFEADGVVTERLKFFNELRIAIQTATPEAASIVYGRKRFGATPPLPYTYMLQGSWRRWRALQAVGDKFEAPLYSAWPQRPPGSLEQAEKLQFRM